LAERFSYVRFSPDEWMSDLGIYHGDDVFRDRLETRLIRLVYELLSKGQSVILEQLAEGEGRKENCGEAGRGAATSDRRERRVRAVGEGQPRGEAARRLAGCVTTVRCSTDPSRRVPLPAGRAP